MNNIPLSSMIAPLSSSSSSSKLSPSSFRNQIVYEASSFQQQQQQLPLQCQSLLFTQPSQQQTFIQENDRMIINPTNQLPTNSFVLLTTVDGQTFLAPSGANFNSIYPTGNQANSYILIPNPTSSISGSNSTSTTTTTTTTTTSSSSSNAISATTATAVTTNNSNNNSNNLTLRPEYMDALYSQSQHSVQQNPFILSGLGSQVLRTQNLVSSHQLATTSIATSRSSVTPRAFHQPIAYHLTSNPSSNNSIPVNLILLSTSNSSPSTFTPSPILLNATPTPTLTTPTTTTTALQAQSQSSNLATVYQTENRCDFDFSQCSTRDTNLIDSFQPIIIQRNDSNMTTLLVNTNNDGGTPVHRAITLMNSANPTSVNNSCNMTPVTLTLTTPKTTIPTTGTTITLPACNQIFYGRNSLQHQQQQQQHSQLPVLFDTSDMDQKLTASTTAATAAALFQVSPLKPTYQSQNSIVQALSCGQLVAIAQPGVGNSNIQPQLSTVIERKQESSTLPNQMQQQIQQRLQQQHQLINSSDLINDQSTITFLPFSNNHLTNNSITTTTTTANSSNINGNSSNNHKPDLYFELPIGDGDQHGTTGQTIYRLFCTDNSDRTIITNGTVSSDNEISRLFVVNNDHRLSDTMMNILTVDNSSYPSTLSSTTRTMTTGAAADHQFIIDQFPSIVNQHQHQLNGYASLSIPTASCITLSPPSSSSVLSTFSLASSSPSVAVTAAAATTITTTTTLAPSSPRLSSASSLFASNIHQTSKNSLITTSSLVNKVKRSNQLSEIHVDIGNRTTTNGNSISSDGGDTDGVNNSSHHLNAGYHIKIDESQYASPSLMTTTKLENYMDNNNNNDNDDCNNISNNDNDSNSNSKHHSNNSLSVLPPLSSMTCHLIPMEPKPDQLKTLQSVINSASAFQCSDFPAYVEQLFRKGILSGRRPWCLNFTAWFINTLVFEVENRTEHVSLRWGDFRLCQTADGQTEYIYFINRITNKHYYLAGSPSSCCALGYKKSEFDAKSSNEPPVRCPCPVAIFKELRDRRPSGCLDAYSKFYLQPRNVECPEANDIEEIHDKVQKPHLLPASSNWFTVHAWGKNKLGGLFAEASKLAGLPTIWLRKHRSRNFFPGGGGSGIGALGNLHHNQYLQKSINNLHRINSRTNDNDDIEHGEITSKENQELTGHTEVKRRRIMNCVTDTSSVLSLSLTMPMVAMSATPPTTLMNNNQSDSNVTGCVNILPSSMTILKPKETIYTSTIS
ncbi:unnamed protein product [Heterobilharzia americana]|nr:unnamed protein product [Heterobilharzia americana]